MRLDVTGLPLEMAKKMLDSNGISVSSVDFPVPPQGSTRHRLNTGKSADYVATAFYTDDDKSVALRAVSVPEIISVSSTE